MAKTVKTTKRAVKADPVRKAMDKNIARNVAKRAAKAPAKGTRSLSTAEAVRKLAKSGAIDPIAKAIAADKPTPITELDAFFPATDAKAASKPAKAGKAKAATTKPAKAGKAATASAKPATPATKPQGEVTGAKATIIGLIRDAKGGVSAGEIAKKLGWPKAGGTISRAIKLAPFKVRKERVDGTLRYFAA
jgi:hypothetical protein